MKYTEPVFRPPFEADSLLLQVTVGCSHNACSFCTMYRDVVFSIESIDQIEKDLHEAREAIPHIERIFLVNADPFALSAKHLAAIGEMINEIIPEIKTISMYASILNIKNKSNDELLKLRSLGFNDFNIGVESGLPGMMEHFNKGYDLATAKEQLLRLKQAGYIYSLNIIIGGAGTDRHLSNARANAELVNETRPRLVFLANLHVDPGSALYEEMVRGEFVENTLRQNIEEEIEFLQGLTLHSCLFYGMHTSNVIPVQGMLPQAKGAMLERLQMGLVELDNRILDARNLDKGREGNLLGLSGISRLQQ